ncbi:transposase [Vibrio breoganii]|nr:transposase [Vibrio breoganii]PMO70372.1 transposase [Vibrio breoganii]
MTEKRAYKRYPKEFKEEAVAFVREQGYSVAQAAEAVGVTTTVLCKWKEKLEAQLEGSELSDDERDEIKRLRKEVKELRIEKEI